MNREIKFRFWNREQKKFYYANTLESIRLVGKEAGNIPLNWMIEQQYTGLKDSKNVEIYEGDIVKVGYGEYIGSLGQAIFEYGSFMLTSKYGCNFMDTYKSCLYGEVVGNIFENPELL